MSTLTQEELRRRRLTSLGCTIDEVKHTAPSGSVTAENVELAPSSEDAESSQVQEGELREAQGLLWPPTSTDDDKRRWNNQGFTLRGDPTFGLQQGEGGPCGVLAAVQAEVVRTLIFGRSSSSGPPTTPRCSHFLSSFTK
ncbi:unnamed protein product [Choristocarpus tenellus]